MLVLLHWSLIGFRNRSSSIIPLFYNYNCLHTSLDSLIYRLFILIYTFHFISIVPSKLIHLKKWRIHFNLMLCPLQLRKLFNCLLILHQIHLLIFCKVNGLKAIIITTKYELGGFRVCGDRSSGRHYSVISIMPPEVLNNQAPNNIRSPRGSS